MHIYNVTTNIDESVHDEWLQWMKNTYIPAMLATGKFTGALMSRVLVNEAMGGITYSVQYKTPSKETLQKFYVEDADTLNKMMDRYKGKAVFFSTEMKIMHEQ